jgi:antitoxin component YwqK of YwqJK toxin-antitoxin module
MLKNINSISTKFLCTAIVVFMLISCTQQEVGSEGKLVFEKLTDSSTRISGATINGKKQGLWINYNDSGRVSSYDTYVNDSLSGESIGFFSDGTISSKGVLKNGQREGEWILYYDKDKIAEKGSYHNGNKVGVWEYYIEEGKLDKQIEYDKGGKQKDLEDNHLMPPVPNK